MTKLIDKSRALFGLEPVRDALDRLRGEVSGLSAKLEAARRRREDLLSQPVSKSELTTAAARWVDLEGEKYRQRLHSRLGGIAGRPLDVERISDHPLGRWALLGITDRNAHQADRLEAGALALLFGDELKERFAAEIGQLDFPVDAPALPERKKMAAKLDEEIETTESNLPEIVNAARASGVILRTST